MDELNQVIRFVEERIAAEDAWMKQCSCSFNHRQKALAGMVAHRDKLLQERERQWALRIPRYIVVKEGDLITKMTEVT